uniref:Reverse transcriptase Ty1/copia-type domain-containing protein n=1 Tax=Amphimedon queenslandica TaxID=400682 RepID=A0A1X7VWA0_AMPQE
MGFCQTKSDPCIYVSKTGEPFTITIYVDDILFASKTDERLDDVKRKLASKFKIKDLGELRYFLGVKVVQNTEKQTIWLGQPSYTKQLLEEFSMSDAKATKTPVNPVSSVARYTAKQTSEHWKAVKHIIRYLVGTVDFGLLYSRTSSICMGYSDSNWGGDLDDREPTSVCVFPIGGGPVSWQSQKQSCVALSTSEAEYIALTSAAQEAIWLRHLLSEVEQEEEKTIVIYEDNQSTICLSKNPQFHGRSKHIVIKYHFIRDQVKDGTVELKYCKTEEMLADVFTL